MDSTKRRWLFRNGQSYEDYTVLFSDGKFLLVQNDNTGKFSFGLERDFGSLCGFPVNQSCLTSTEIISLLERFVEIDKTYLPDSFASDNISRWSSMISVIQAL